MAVLNTKSRNALPDSAFALSGRRYPIHDRAHAKDALSRGAHDLSPAELATLKRKVKARYPDMQVK